MSRKNVSIPLNLITGDNLSTAAKVIYAVLKTFQTGRIMPYANDSVVVTHNQIIKRSSLSKHTVIKALNLLEATGWIEREVNSGFASEYIFTIPPNL